LQQASDSIPQIKLFPGRLGGNMADDGIIYILSFAPNSEYRYGEVKNSGNRYFDLNKQSLSDQFSDERDQIPAVHSQIALGLRNFDYKHYIETYSLWTVADYQSNDPVGFRRLKAWLEQRIKEYETSERIELDRENHPILPKPTEEQQTHVINTLRPALALLNNSTDDFLSTRIADLQSMPIRSFIIKRLAVREGEVILDPLNVDEIEHRTAQLKWFLGDELPVDCEENSPDVILPTAPQKLPKNYGGLEIMATFTDITQGQTVTFSVNEADYMQLGDRASYYWTVKGQTGNQPTFELDTSEWAEGEHNIRATLYVKPANGGLVRQIPGSALFEVKAPEAAAPAVPNTEKPLQTFGDLREYLQVNCAHVNRGQKLIVSLDQAFIKKVQQGATLRYYWKALDCPASHTERYELNTTNLDLKEHTIRVAMYRTDLVSNESEQFSGIAVVKVLTPSAPMTQKG
jgi:hypothetical protein